MSYLKGQKSLGFLKVSLSMSLSLSQSNLCKQVELSLLLDELAEANNPAVVFYAHFPQITIWFICLSSCDHISSDNIIVYLFVILLSHFPQITFLFICFSSCYHRGVSSSGQSWRSGQNGQREGWGKNLISIISSMMSLILPSPPREPVSDETLP